MTKEFKKTDLDAIVQSYKNILTQYIKDVKVTEEIEEAVIECIMSIGNYENVKDR